MYGIIFGSTWLQLWNVLSFVVYLDGDVHMYRPSLCWIVHTHTCQYNSMENVYCRYCGLVNPRVAAPHTPTLPVALAQEVPVISVLPDG